MTEQPSGHADWREVGEAFRTLGLELRDHAVEAGGVIKESAAGSGKILDEVGDALKAALGKFDETVTDPAVGTAAKTAVNKLLDAIKTEVNRPKAEG